VQQSLLHQEVERVVVAEVLQVQAEAQELVEVLPQVVLEVSVRRVQVAPLEQDLSVRTGHQPALLEVQSLTAVAVAVASTHLLRPQSDQKQEAMEEAE
jgi:hypothetical protein